MSASLSPLRQTHAATQLSGLKDELSISVGDIYLAALPELEEVEVEDVVPAAQVLKIKGRGWMEREAFAAAVKTKLGRAVYSEGLFGAKRRFVREA